jgi:hypothetical protein
MRIGAKAIIAPRSVRPHFSRFNIFFSSSFWMLVCASGQKTFSIKIGITTIINKLLINVCNCGEAAAQPASERFYYKKLLTMDAFFFASHLMADERTSEKGQLIAESDGEKFIAKPQSDGFVFGAALLTALNY